MKSTRWGMLAAFALLLVMAGCAPSGAATAIPTLALEPAGSLASGTVKASAEIVPAQDAQLSFVISGPIAEVLVQEGQAVEAGQTLATLDVPDLEYGLTQAQAAVREAEYEYEYWKLPRIIAGRLVERGDLARQELAKTQRSLDTALAELAQTELSAPFEGTVISVAVKPGEYVRPGQVVVVLADLQDLQVETTDLSERDVAAVQTGQPASVYVEALDEEFQGQVSAISPISNTIGGDVVFKVTVQFEEPPPGLRWGMSAEARIQTED